MSTSTDDEELAACTRFSGSADLTEPIDVYSEWIDAADAAQREEQAVRRPHPSSSRSVVRPAPHSDDE